MARDPGDEPPPALGSAPLHLRSDAGRRRSHFVWRPRLARSSILGELTDKAKGTAQQVAGSLKGALGDDV